MSWLGKRVKPALIRLDLGGGVAPSGNADTRVTYQRAMTACLEARGYSVK